jgi:glycosyltransferase involved in cell wall biosynthesis
MSNLLETFVNNPLSPPASDGLPDALESSQPIRVCHVSMFLETGGLERLLVDFARFHDRNKFHLQFIALTGDGQPADDIRAAGCAVRVLNESLKIRKLRSIAQLSRHLRRHRTQVVHTHNTYAQFYGTIAAKLAAVPNVINTQHGGGCGESWKARAQFKFANRWTQRVVGVSHDAARLCQQQDYGSRNKITTIWNGINLDRFTFHGPKPVPTAISVARLSATKDFPTLLRAIPLVLPQVPDFRLRIVGDGPERSKLEALIDELNLRPQVELLGERNDVPALLADSGFFVSSSLSEGISLTLLEAMAIGLPIVTTAVGGNPEVVLDRQTGHLVPAADPAALAQAIVDLCSERDLWSAMGVLGRQRVEQNFEIRQMIRNYETLYEELLQPSSFHPLTADR